MALEKQLEFEFMKKFREENKLEEQRLNNLLYSVVGMLSGTLTGLIITHPQEIYDLIKTGLTYSF